MTFGRIASILEPEVVVMEVTFDGISGIGAVEEIATRAPESRILTLTASNERDRVLEKAYLSQGLQVEKDARGRITKVSRPPRAGK